MSLIEYPGPPDPPRHLSALYKSSGSERIIIKQVFSIILIPTDYNLIKMSSKHIRFAIPPSATASCVSKRFPRSPNPQHAPAPKPAPSTSTAVPRHLFGLGLGYVGGSTATITVGSPPTVFSRGSDSLVGLGISYLPFSLIPAAFPDGSPLTGELAALEYPSSRLPNPYSPIGLGIALFGAVSAAGNRALVGLGFSGFDIPQSASTIYRYPSPILPQPVRCHSDRPPCYATFLKSPRLRMPRSLSVGAFSISTPFETPRNPKEPCTWTSVISPWISDMSPSPWIYPRGITTPVFSEE
jgi:hypothetical protein